MTAPTIEEVLFWALNAEAIDHLTTCPRNDGPNDLCCVVGALVDEAADEAGLRMETVSGGWPVAAPDAATGARPGTGMRGE